MRRLLNPFIQRLHKRVDDRVDSWTIARLDQFTSQLEEARRAAIETQRLMTDDLDAATEANALLGRTLDLIRQDLAAMQAELAQLRAAVERSR